MIRVRFFAVLRDRAGVSEFELEVAQSASIETALAMIVARFPSVASEISRVAVAVNREYSAKHAALHDGDELALIPPVSGG